MNARTDSWGELQSWLTQVGEVLLAGGREHDSFLGNQDAMTRENRVSWDLRSHGWVFFDFLLISLTWDRGHRVESCFYYHSIAAKAVLTAIFFLNSVRRILFNFFILIAQLFRNDKPIIQWTKKSEGNDSSPSAFIHFPGPFRKGLGPLNHVTSRK